MAKKRSIYNKSRLYLEIASNGQITHKAHYDYLKIIFNTCSEKHKKFFYDANIVNHDTGNLIKRDFIDQDTTYKIFTQFNNIGMLERADEINYIDINDFDYKKKF
ncbi:hypothetical protein [Spiroplasma tabanidicola]|uniref:Uncharacterized protein n=1 Tax=Spiroplasma tabanidicola TaxID=324079 RepID=A0A6I6C4W9_9MOLU|nr:hypothetical protein [Spiroplasma tabanidicola]QGS51867.1 hypothetical protein STABA_v1c05040 [Spiroplasma tabanidicola]